MYEVSNGLYFLPQLAFAPVTPLTVDLALSKFGNLAGWSCISRLAMADLLSSG
jgi:hypothetical protein